MYPRFALTVGTLALLTAFPAIAATAESETVVVTATRQPTRANELLADVSVIDRQEIERSGQSTIAELLARQPGIQTSSNGGPGTSTSYYVRGARPEQTKVLVDGIPINSIDLSGSPLFLPLADVERIEILRGPASTLYGADAIGGVIQIFTRRGTPGLKADAFLGFGTQRTLQANAGISGGDEQWRFRLEGNHSYSGSISAQKNATNRDADNDPFRNSGGAASVSFMPAKGHELGFTYRQNEGKANYDSGSSPANGTFDNHIDFETKQWQVFSRNKITSAWTSKLQYGESTDSQNNFYSYAPNGSLLRTDNRSLSWQNDISLPIGTALVGIERLEQEASPRREFSGSPEISTDSLLAGWTGNYQAHRWQVSARHDDNSRFGDQNTHALAYGYQITDALRVHVGYGTAFKAPSVYQLFVPYFGNASLQSEKARNREAAVVWERSGQSASATYYLNHVDNLIDYSFATSTYENISKARLEGLTLAYSGRFGNWDFGASYDWLDAINTDTDKQLGRRARNRGMLSIARHWGAFDAGAEWIGVGKRFNMNNETGQMGGYSLLNLTARYAINNELAIEGRINNLLDKNYESAIGYGTLGVNAFVGLRYQMK